MPARQYGVPPDPREESRGGKRRGQSAATGQGALSYGQQNRSAGEPKPRKEDPSPSNRVVDAFHKNADTDSRTESIHHTLGPGPNQASPGSHSHDGSDSVQILAGMTLTGSKATPSTMWPSIIAALVRLGAEDNTT